MSRQIGKSAAKAVDKELRRIGARRSTTKGGSYYVFPDGARLFVESHVDKLVADAIMRDAGRRYGVRPDHGPFSNAQRVPLTQLPKLNLAKLNPTEHAQERFAVMRRQGGVDEREILTTLQCPMRALWMDAYGTYGWVGERITVVGHVREDTLTIRTFLWSTNDLWDQHPRPEKEKTS